MWRLKLSTPSSFVPAPHLRTTDRSSILSIAYANSLHTFCPTRTPERSLRLGSQMRILGTPPCFMPEQNTPFLNITQKAQFFLIHFPVLLIRLWSSCYFDFCGIEPWLRGCSNNKLKLYTLIPQTTS